MNDSPSPRAAEEKWHADFEFRPLPFLRNPHVQTLLGVLVPGADCPLPDQRHIIRLPDGDALVLHNNTPLGWKRGDAVALLVHGLSGSHASAHIRRMTAMLLARRIRVVRIDLPSCAVLLALPKNRIYEDNFLRDLTQQARLRQRYFPDLPPLRFPRRMTIRLFDELYTAPRSGFDDAQDYYQKASCAALIPRIQVPTLILTSRDDPFVAVEPFEQLKVPPHILVRIVPHGGHIGFLGWDGAGGIRWAERRMVEWILQT
jgi:uncharacterized protein